MPFLALLVLFIVVPIVEIYVIIQVGQAIGALPTIGLLILDSILGSMLMKSQGRAVWARFQETLRAGRVPAREVVDGALVLFGGALLLTPGFTTDILGALLLIPPTRAFFRGIIVRRFTFGLMSGAMPRGPAPGGVPPRAPRPGPSRRAPGEAYDVEGTATEIDPEHRRLP